MKTFSKFTNPESVLLHYAFVGIKVQVLNDDTDHPVLGS